MQSGLDVVSPWLTTLTAFIGACLAFLYSSARRGMYLMPETDHSISQNPFGFKSFMAFSLSARFFKASVRSDSR